MPFQPGQSGNPRGRPAGFAGLAAKIKARVGNDGEALVEFAMRVFEGLPDPITNQRPSDKMRWEAMQWLADRGFGKPVTTVDLHVDGASPTTVYNVNVLSSDQLRELNEAMEAMRLGAAVEVKALPKTSGGK